MHELVQMLKINTFVDYGVSPLNFRLGCDVSELLSFTLKRGNSKQSQNKSAD